MKSEINPQPSTNFYSAIFEFAQGSYPHTIWENDNTIIPESEQQNFRLLVVNTPTNIQVSIDNTPTIIRSFYQNIHYLAIFIQILDTEARGFSRPIVFVIANYNQTLIDMILSLYKDKLMELIGKLQYYSNELFPIELRKYTGELKSLISKYGEEYTGLISKLNELEKINIMFGLKNIEECKDCKKAPEDFLKINNNLREIEKLIDLEKQKNEIFEFLSILPKSNYDIMFLSNSIGFNDHFGDDSYMVIKSLKQKDGEIKYSLAQMLQNKTFFDCLFSLMSGKTLVLKTDNLNTGEFLAKRLSILTPFDEHFSIKVFNDVVPTQIDCLPFSIVVVKEIENSELLNIFNMQTFQFEGTKCPKASIIRQITKNNNDISDNIILLNAFNDIKQIFVSFQIKIAEILSRTIQTRERTINSFKTIGFTQEDEPILKYFIYSISNLHKSYRMIVNI